MTNKAIPTRFEDLEFFPVDKLNVKFTFKTISNSPMDLSLSLFTAVASSNNHGEQIAQPEVDMASAVMGEVWLRWTAAQVETLPRFVTVEIAETAAVDVIDDFTWDEAEVTWDELGDVAWSATAIWDRTILVGRLIRNEYGRFE